MQTFEPMSVGRILDQTFRIYKENFVRFITIVAVIEVPIGLLSALFQSMMLGNHPEGSTAPIVGMIGMIPLTVLSMTGTALCSGALTRNVSESYLGRQMTMGQAYAQVLPKLLTLIGAALLVALVVGCGLVLLVVPGVIFALWFALATPAVVVEDLKATAGMKRSKGLVKGNLDKVFLVNLLVIVISWVIILPLALVGKGTGTLVASGNLGTGLVIQQVATLVGQVLAMPIQATALILLYYDLRIRKEGFDLEMLSRSLEAKTTVG